MDYTSIKVNICSLSSNVSNRNNKQFVLVCQDAKSGGFYTFYLMKNWQRTQWIVNDLFKFNVNQDKLFELLSLKSGLSKLKPIGKVYEFKLDSSKEPSFSLMSISDSSRGNKLTGKFTLNRKG